MFYKLCYTSNIARKWASHEAFKIATNMMTADRIAMIENRALGILLAEFKTAVASVPLKPKAQNFFFSPFSSQQQSTTSHSIKINDKRTDKKNHSVNKIGSKSGHNSLFDKCFLEYF